MSIATAITDLSNRIQNAFDACEAKGATMPASKTTWSLSNTIESIPTGGGGSQFGLSLSNFWTLDDNGNLGAPTEVVDVVFDGVKFIEANAFNAGIFNMNQSKCNPHLRNVTFPDLIDIADNALRSAFVSQTQLSNITFSSLLSVSGGYCCSEAFSNAVHINLPELKSVTGEYAFYHNSSNKISSFYAPKLETISATNPFQGLMSPNTVELNLSSVKYAYGNNALLFFNTNLNNFQLTSFNIDSLSVAIGQQAMGNMLYKQSHITGDFELP